MLMIIAAAFAACEPTDVHSAVQKAMDSYSDQDESSTFALATETRANLACATDVVYPSELATLYWLGGASAAKTNQADVAIEWYRAAARIPTRPTWNKLIQRTEPPDYAAALAAPNDATVTSRSDVWLDGYSLSQGQPLNTKSGTHLVQWRTSDGVIHGELVTVGTGSSAIGPTLAPEAPTTTTPAAGSAPKKSTKVARIVLGGAGALVAAGAGVVFYEALNESRAANYGLDETLYRVGAIGLGVGVGTMLVSTVFLADGSPGFGVSGQF